MYPGEHPRLQPDRPAVIMAGSGEILTYGELERHSNKLAHLLRANALQRLDHFAIFMENNFRYVECCAAGERAGLYYTCINSYLTPDELAYIVNNSESRILVTSMGSARLHWRRYRNAPRSSYASSLTARATTRQSAISTRPQRAFPIRRSRMRRSVLRCSIRLAQPVGRRAFYGHCPISRRPGSYPSTIS
jgi:acyl-CoA synthetase (AMP-forming)/AMP-acid ligase II